MTTPQPLPDAASIYARESIGEIIRWINREHMAAAKETPPNMDYMRAMQDLGANLESALDQYRKARKDDL